ncbi:hypothetical protein A9Q88_12305 [Gammaproteobacteria bacterium 50_400_T64]|nr:hypothetical protein A9Q88_12305 [Gammaproteobacteria bacterium 50_400_T64]
MFLCADIGGTKTRLCLVADNASYKPLHLQTYLNAKFYDFNEILSDFLQQHKPAITFACLATAGPVHNNHCAMTNLNWQINGADISQHFSIKSTILINDLSATALAVPLLNKDDFIVLQNAPPKLHDGPIAVIAAGTGLGESVLVWDHNLKHHHTINSEGGHKDFSPHDAISRELNEYVLTKESCGFLSIEDLLSGRGLQRMYTYFTREHKTQDLNETISPAQILDKANAGHPAAIATVQCFIRLMATEASNVAMQYFSTGGVVIAGGLMPRLLAYLDVTRFLTCFTDKHQFHDWLATIPLVICHNTDAPLIGAFYYLQQFIRTENQDLKQ